MTKGSILMFKSVYGGTSGHDKVIENISIGLNKLGYTVTIGSFLFLKDPPLNIPKIVLTRLGVLRNKELEKFENYLPSNLEKIHSLSKKYNLKLSIFMKHLLTIILFLQISH